MNRFIARLFGLLLAVIHVLVIVGFVMAAVDIATGADQLSAFAPQLAAGPTLQRYATLLAAFLSYVLVMGALSTLVSINQHMAAIRKMSAEAESPGPSRSRSSVRRRG